MQRIALAILSSLSILIPALTMAANDVAIDANVLTNDKVERNGKHVGTATVRSLTS